MARQTMVVGHRGWLERFPENTLVGLEAAVGLGCDALEFDLHLTRDARVVVMHDPTVDRTTDGTGHIRDKTLGEIKQLDAGGWLDRRFRGERVPTLEEVLERVPSSVFLYAEVKDYGQDMVETLVPLVEPLGDGIVVHSFGADFIERFRQAAPGIRTGLLGHVDKADLLAEARRLGCWGIHPCMAELSREAVAGFQRHGFTVMTWTVRDEATAREAIGLQPDAIGADCPDVVLRLLGR